jgi:hypothetical protein
MRTQVLLHAVASILILAYALSPESPIPPKRFIDIVNPLGKNQERLPAGFIQEWPTWTCSLHETGTSTGTRATSSTAKWSRIKSSNDPGLVNPFSIDYLWQPVDLNPPQCTLALAVHCRNGVPRHLMPAIDVAYGADGLHRNRGLHTSPRAWQWFDFRSYVAGTRKCRLELRTFDPAETGPNRKPIILQTFDDVDTLVDNMLLAMSDDPPPEVGSGSIIVQATTGAPSFALPKHNHVLSAVLFENDDSLIGSLDVLIETVSAGSRSEYLPEAYRSLFQDEMRPEYEQFQQRQTERGQ